MFVPTNRRTLIVENSEKRSLSYETKTSISFISMSKMSLWYPIMKRKGLLCESLFFLIERRTLILKDGQKKSFSYETKAIMSLNPKRRMSLWFPIMKRKEIIT